MQIIRTSQYGSDLEQMQQRQDRDWQISYQYRVVNNTLIQQQAKDLFADGTKSLRLSLMELSGVTNRS